MPVGRGKGRVKRRKSSRGAGCLGEGLRRLGKFVALIIDDLAMPGKAARRWKCSLRCWPAAARRAAFCWPATGPSRQRDRIFKDALTTAAAVGRLVHRSVILELDIPSCRMESAQKRQTRGKGQEA